MASTDFDRSVFINCPFDKDFEPLLQAMLFCIVYVGLKPRIASESYDSASVRLTKILKLVRAARYSIHDLSRIQASASGQFFRLNMPFELGLDYGCLTYGASRFRGKRILILEQVEHQYQIGLSDLAGCDVQSHDGDFEQVIRKVRNWLVTEAATAAPGAARIVDAYVTFQQWYYEKQLAAGFSESDIQDYPTSELLSAMTVWIESGKPS